MTRSAVAGLRAETAEVQGMLGAAAAGSIDLTNSYAGVLAAREVRGERIDTLVLLGGRVHGEVHTVVDTRAAVIAGLLGGLFGGLLFMLGKALFERSD